MSKEKRYKCRHCLVICNGSPTSSTCGSIDCLLAEAMGYIGRSRKKDAKRKRKEWAKRKAELKEELGMEPRGNQDVLQRYINKIVRFIDKDLNCYVLPDYKTNGQPKQAGHVISRSNCSKLKYLLLNIHGESVFSNSNKTISDADKIKALMDRYTPSVEAALDWIKDNNEELSMNQEQRQEKANICKEILLELKNGSKISRREIDERIGIYRLPSKEVYNI